MKPSDFIPKAQELVANYTNKKLKAMFTNTMGLELLEPEDVYVVWSCKTLQNSKAMLSTDIRDGMYYEVTYNGDKNEIYFDAYRKEHNEKVEV
mgnify:CR=1 FL=1